MKKLLSFFILAGILLFSYSFASHEDIYMQNPKVEIDLEKYGKFLLVEARWIDVPLFRNDGQIFEYRTYLFQVLKKENEKNSFYLLYFSRNGKSVKCLIKIFKKDEDDIKWNYGYIFDNRPDLPVPIPKDIPEHHKFKEQSDQPKIPEKKGIQI